MKIAPSLLLVVSLAQERKFHVTFFFTKRTFIHFECSYEHYKNFLFLVAVC